MKILKYQSFLNENTSINSNSMKTIEKYYNEMIALSKNLQDPLWKLGVLNGYFFNIVTFRGYSKLGEELMEEFKEVFEKISFEKRQDILEKYLKTLLIFEFRIDKMTGNSQKGNTGKKDKLSTKRSTLDYSFGEDKFSKARKIYEPEIQNNITNFEKILGKMKSELNNKPVNTESTKSSDTKDPQVRYKELLSEWKESQKKLNKNTSPGQGTRARLMKQAKSELGIKEHVIFKFESFDYEEPEGQGVPEYEKPEGQGEPEEAQGEPDFRKIMVPGTNLNLDEFEKRLGQRISQYELSKDGKQVTEINGKPIADVVAEEFPEGE